jgi:hypothetical protein
MFSDVSKAQVAWGLAIGILAGVISALLVIFIRSIGDPDPVRKQIAEIRRDAAAEHGTHLIENERVDLEGGGQRAYLLAFRHDSLRTIPSGEEVQTDVSDEIRIYRVDDDGDVVEAFRFQPRPRIDPVPGGPDTKRPYLFNVHSVSDLDGNGRPELIGAFKIRAMEDADPFPVAITWEDESQQYRLVALLPNRPDLAHSSIGLWARLQLQDYITEDVLRDPDAGVKLTGFAVEGYDVVRTPLRREPALAVGYVVHAAAHASSHKRIEMQVVVLDLQAADPRTFTCSAVEREGLRAGGVLIPPRYRGGFAEFDTSEAIAMAYPAVKDRFAC